MMVCSLAFGLDRQVASIWRHLHLDVGVKKRPKVLLVQKDFFSFCYLDVKIYHLLVVGYLDSGICIPVDVRQDDGGEGNRGS